MTQPLRRTRYETIGQDETLSIELPDGIGAVHIRTGETDVRSGNPRISIEVVSDTLDRAADDGRYYESSYDSMTETIHLIGRPGDEMAARRNKP